MRSLTSFLFGLVAVIALTILLPVAWVAMHVASEDGYVEFSESMVQDQPFRDALMTATADEIVARTALPSVAVEPVRIALKSAASALAESPRFVDAWSETQRQSHRAVFADPGDLPADLDASNRLVLDVAPVAQAVVDSVSDKLPVRVDVPGQMLVTVGGSEQRHLIDTVRTTPETAALIAVLTVVAAVVSVISARRRFAAIALLGVAAAVAAGVTRIVTHAVVPEVLSRSGAPSELARTTQQLLADRAVESLDSWGVAVMVAGVIVAVGGWIAGAARNRLA